FPALLAEAPISWNGSGFVSTGSMLNLPAILIVAAVTGLCYRGITQSAFANAILVALKIAVIAAVLAFGAQYIDPGNWVPLRPASPGPGRFGFDGVTRAAALVFFASLGFDAVSSAAGEARNPQRDMPIGI